MDATIALQQITGYHCTSKEVWKKIKESGLKGSKWSELMPELKSMNSNPFKLYRDGAVWCYADLATARLNQEDGEVILRIEGMGLIVEHEAHGACVVGKANLCQASLVRFNTK